MRHAHSALEVVPTRRRPLNAALAVILALTTAAGSAPPVLGANDKPPALVGGSELWVGELGPPTESFDHIVMMWDEIIDPGSIPAPADFSVSINSVATAVTDVSLIFAGFADESFGLSNDGTSFMRVDLATSWTGMDTVLVTYVPGANPVRDLGLGEAAGFVDVPATTFDPLFFELTSAAIDSYYGADHLLLAATHPLVPASIPSADAFTVTVDGDEIDVLSVAHLHPDLGLGLLDLELNGLVTDSEAQVFVSYAAGATPLTSARTGSEISLLEDLPVALVLSNDVVSTEVAAGGTASTTSPDGPTVADPIGTTVTSPTGGTVTITESNVLDPPTEGYTFFGQQVVITAPDALTAEDPLVLRFDIDSSVVPEGEDEQTIAILRNGIEVPACTGDPGVADPSPCVSARLALADGDISLTVLTVEASTWNLAVRTPMTFAGFFPPVDNDVANRARAGSAIPVKFSLGGDRGLDIFSPGSPASKAISCDLVAESAVIEETVTAGSSSLSYDAVADEYTYVWKTSRTWDGSCRRLVVTFSDGTMASASFDFRR